MTTITTLNLTDAVTVDVTEISILDKTTLKAGSTTDDKKGGLETEYRKVTGDEEYPLTARVGRYINAKANGGVGQTNVSLRVSTFLQKEDVDDVIWTLPGGVTVAFFMPGTSGFPDVDGAKILLASAFSLLVPIIAGELSDDAMDEIKYGVLNVLDAHVDSGSV